MSIKENHIITFDILKGFLIISVVIGHVYAPLSWLDVFWFHMPAFFLISGYVTKDWYLCKKYVEKKIVRLWIPYIVYCVILLPFIPNVSVVKQLLKFVLGGWYSTTCLTFPFWFANSMLIACIIYSYLRTYVSMKVRVCLILIIWFGIHAVHVPDYLTVYLPFGVDMALGGVCYIEAGVIMRSIDKKYVIWLCVVFVFAFALCNACDWISYRLNMMSMLYNHIVLDFLVPLSFTVFIYMLCLYVEKNTFASKIFQSIGLSSMSIMFMHVAIIHLCSNIGIIKSLGVIVGMLLPVIANHFYGLKPIARLLFLGNYNDYKLLLKR